MAAELSPAPIRTAERSEETPPATLGSVFWRTPFLPSGRLVDVKDASFRRNPAVVAAVVILTLAGCRNTDSWVEAAPAPGWPAQYGDASNTSYTHTTGATTLKLGWTRSVKGSLAAAPALSGRGWMVLNAQTPAGCSLMEWENDDNGRQRWCVRLVQGGGFAGPLFDGFDNVYVGQPGAMMSFPPTQWTRWRAPVIGMPSTPRILKDGQLLVVTHLGQVLVFDAHRGTVVGSPLDLVEGVDSTDPTRGLSDCAPARPGCPVAAAPAFAATTGAVVLGLWEPGANAAVLVGLKYHPGQNPLLTREWTSDAVATGVLASPVLSADGSTVYVNGRDQQLWALHAADGKPKWSAPLKFLAQTPPTLTPGGLIVSGGGPDTQLVAFKDAGDHAELVWRRDDVTPLCTSSLAGSGVGYTVAKADRGMSLLIFDPRDGHTHGSYPLPEATGYPVGVAVGHDRRVVAATSDGQVYSFAPA
ncbi:PQQ-like beta-propeller repeat protein [Mycobacterium branderi]|nr:PQQ-like beta-propeller repeat protein [Mycobacterium branderi]